MLERDIATGDYHNNLMKLALAAPLLVEARRSSNSACSTSFEENSTKDKREHNKKSEPSRKVSRKHTRPDASSRKHVSADSASQPPPSSGGEGFCLPVYDILQPRRYRNHPHSASNTQTNTHVDPPSKSKSTSARNTSSVARGPSPNDGDLVRWNKKHKLAPRIPRSLCKESTVSFPKLALKAEKSMSCLLTEERSQETLPPMTSKLNPVLRPIAAKAPVNQELRYPPPQPVKSAALLTPSALLLPKIPTATLQGSETRPTLHSTLAGSSPLKLQPVASVRTTRQNSSAAILKYQALARDGTWDEELRHAAQLQTVI